MAALFSEWMFGFSEYDAIGEPQDQPSGLFLLPEVFGLVASQLEIGDKVALSRTCRLAYRMLTCRCCLTSPCRDEVESHIDFLSDQREAWMMYMEEMRDDDSGGDYDIDWEAE